MPNNKYWQRHIIYSELSKTCVYYHRHRIKIILFLGFAYIRDPFYAREQTASTSDCSTNTHHLELHSDKHAPNGKRKIVKINFPAHFPHLTTRILPSCVLMTNRAWVKPELIRRLGQVVWLGREGRKKRKGREGPHSSCQWWSCS